MSVAEHTSGIGQRAEFITADGEVLSQFLSNQNPITQHPAAIAHAVNSRATVDFWHGLVEISDRLASYRDEADVFGDLPESELEVMPFQTGAKIAVTGYSEVASSLVAFSPSKASLKIPKGILAAWPAFVPASVEAAQRAKPTIVTDTPETTGNMMANGWALTQRINTSKQNRGTNAGPPLPNGRKLSSSRSEPATP